MPAGDLLSHQAIILSQQDEYDVVNNGKKSVLFMVLQKKYFNLQTVGYPYVILPTVNLNLFTD